MDYFRKFKTPTKFAQEYLFFSDGMGELEDKGFFIERTNFRNYLIMYVISGTLHVEQNGHFVLKQGDGIVISLTKWHKYYTDSKDICRVLWMHFGGIGCNTILTTLQNQVFKIERVAELIRNCFDDFSSNSAQTEFKISESIYSILMEIVFYQRKEISDDSMDEHSSFMNKATMYVDHNIHQMITLQEFANHFNMSKYYFCRTFKKVFGLTPMQYILSKKVELSKYLLVYTNEPLSNISASLGFTDQSHFSNTFRRFENKTPMTVRKRGL